MCLYIIYAGGNTMLMNKNHIIKCSKTTFADGVKLKAMSSHLWYFIVFLTKILHVFILSSDLSENRLFSNKPVEFDLSFLHLYRKGRLFCVHASFL